MTSSPNGPPVVPGDSGGDLAKVVDAVVTFLVATARRVAAWLRPVAIAAFIAGVVVWAAVGAPLLDDAGSTPLFAVLVAVLALAPAVLVVVNRRQLLAVGEREDVIRAELQGVVNAFRDRQAIAARLYSIRDRLQDGGIRDLIAVGHDVRQMQRATEEVRDRRDAMVAAFGLGGFAGLGVAVGAAALVILAAPVAVVVALVLWAA